MMKAFWPKRKCEAGHSGNPKTREMVSCQPLGCGLRIVNPVAVTVRARVVLVFGKAILVAAIAMTAVSPGRADVLYTNGNGIPDGTSASINSNTSGCNPDYPCRVTGDGWTVFSRFSLGSSADIAGFTYYSDFSPFSSADYVSTNWSIWTTNPVTVGAHPIFSGTAGTIPNPPSDDAPVTVSGLNIDLAAGQYWIGLQNNLDNPNAYSLYDVSDNGNPALQIDNFRQYFAADLQPAAFTINGVYAQSVPEFPTWWLMALGFAGLAAGAGRRKLRAIVADRQLS
jgi:hypothetical protein